MKINLYLGIAALHFGLAGSALAQTVTGAGSSAAAPIYQSWARAYQKATGVGLNYDPAGSSAGIKKIRAHETGFGASDVAPPETELTADGLVLFPVAVTGIAPVVNLPKIADGQLKLTGDVLARIFMGEITQWNAADIAKLNPGLALPDLAIKVVVRGDGSGTTYNFADYLSKVHPAWKSKYGAKTTIAWPTSMVAVKGSSGVVKAVKETNGAIGYVDHGYVVDNALNSLQMKNADNEFVKPTTASFRAALAGSDWVSKGSFSGTLTDMGGKGAWPITMGTFVLVPKVTDKAAETQAALKFFVWAFMNGDALVQESNFVRLPDRVQAAAFKAITSVKDKAGNSIGMGAMSAGGPAR